MANAGPDQVVTRGVTATTVTLTGAGSTPGATYLWEQTGGSPADAVTLTGATTLNPTFVLRLFRVPMTNSPLTFRLTVTAAGGSHQDGRREGHARCAATAWRHPGPVEGR